MSDETIKFKMDIETLKDNVSYLCDIIEKLNNKINPDDNYENREIFESICKIRTTTKPENYSVFFSKDITLNGGME